MAGPLEGVKAVELGLWVAAPSAAAILSDWGAQVIKIEPPEVGQHTEEILLELGHNWEGIVALKERGVIP